MNSVASRVTSQFSILARFVVAIVGGYVFSWGLIALALVGLGALGMPFEDAEHLSSILAVLLYLATFLCAFAVRSLVRVSAVLLGGAALMVSLASLLQARLVA